MSSLDAKIRLCESILDYTFNDRLLCARALNTTGNMVVWEDSLRLIPKNQELAIYGDTVLAAKVCRDWLNAGLSKSIAKLVKCKELNVTSAEAWTTIIQSIASNTNLPQVGNQAGLDACVNLNAGTDSVSTATMSTTVEAILGAVYLDGGDNALASVMEKLQLTHEILIQTVTFFSLLPLQECDIHTN